MTLEKGICYYLIFVGKWYISQATSTRTKDISTPAKIYLSNNEKAYHAGPHHMNGSGDFNWKPISTRRAIKITKLVTGNI